eukprot:3337167-Amphidinium_carterae.1
MQECVLHHASTTHGGKQRGKCALHGKLRPKYEGQPHTKAALQSEGQPHTKAAPLAPHAAGAAQKE